MTDKKYEFLVFAPNKWEGQWMNRQHIFSRIGFKHRVIYSNGPLHIHQRKSPDFKNSSWRGRLEQQDNVLVSKSPKLIPYRNKESSLYEKLSGALYAKYLEKHFSNPNDKILYLFHPAFYSLKKHIPNSLTIYHCYDDYSKQGYYTDKLKTDEIKLCQESDIVFASSQNIQRRLINISGRSDIFFLPNGVNYDFFSQSPDHEPKDLAEIPSPRVSYIGSINEKFDFELWDKLSSVMPNVSFIVIGPSSNLIQSDAEILSLMQRKNNVYLLGDKHHSELPAYMHFMDVNTMAYRLSDTLWTTSIYPLKMHEYLAVGKPVISSRVDAVEEFSNVIEIADTTKDWQEKIQYAIDKGMTSMERVAKRRTAKENTWEQRIETIFAHIESHKDNKNSG